MARPRFLLDEPLGEPGEYRLPPWEAHHALDVFRFGPGDAILVFDGRGRSAEAVITEVRKDRMLVRAERIQADARPSLKLTVATAIPKGKRWQILVEKCTELGADRIIPVLTGRGVARGEGDIDKWRRWAAEAAKQARRSWIPEITEPEPFAAVPALARGCGALLLIADGRGEKVSTLREALPGTPEVVIMVGPEGGFTEDELAQCAREGARSVCLSPFVLRVETAAAAACALVREVAP